MARTTLQKPTFSVEQMISSTEAGRKFSELRKRAAIEPQFVTDHNAVETVVLSYKYYEEIYTELQALKEAEFERAAANRLQNEQSAFIPLQDSMTPEEFASYSAINADEIADEDLFI
jgi:PHD/YefM family antitoxin component YafN of YafNO toxin-antitoxin module